MAKQHKPEEIVAKLRQLEVLVGQGKTVAEGARAIGVTEATYYRWRAEYGAKAVKDWIIGVRASTAYIAPGSPWENGYVESFNGKLRNELLGCEVFNSPAEAKMLIEQWPRHYNTVRPHSALGDRPPAPEVVLMIPPMLPGIPEPTGSAPPRPAMH